MTDNIDNIVIEHLKALRGELKEFRNKHDGDMADIKHRLTALERGMGAVKRDASIITDSFLHYSMDRNRIFTSKR